MRLAGKQRVSQVYPLGAPILGLNDTDSIADMDPKYALDMLNVFPELGALKVRWGYVEHVTGMTDNGKTLMVFNNQDGTSKLFCATDDGIFDVTASTASPSNVKALTEGEMVWTQFANIAGQWLIACNGVDAPVIYDGTTWTSFSNVASPTNPGELETGTLTVANIAYVHVHKNRLWFIEKDTLSAWYLPLNAVSGTPVEFPLGGIFTKGGQLNALFSLTMDSGIGSDDVLVFQSTKGEVGGYIGANPADAADWRIIARYFIGAPLGKKTNVQLNGDILLLTEFGVVSLLDVVNGLYRLGAEASTASAKISRTISNIVRDGAGAPLWEIFNSPVYQYVIISVPENIALGIPAKQLVMNSVTGAWTKFDLPALTLYEFGQNIFFTDLSGRVHKYGGNTNDEITLAGTGAVSIISGFQQAYSFFEQPTVKKHFKMVKPIFQASNEPQVVMKVLTDYLPGGVNSVNTPGAAAVPPVNSWDSTQWDEGQWLRTLVAFQTFLGSTGFGYSGSVIVKLRTSVETRYLASHWIYEQGLSL